MPPKRGKKRKTTASSEGTSNGDAGPPTPLDRATWPGWVEMESEPAFFDVMLRDMGVQGVKVQEVYSLDDDMLATLPRPVHALIFLFRYRDSDDVEPEGGGCPEHVWFANQTPDFACATFALLNIINNIPGLDLGKQLREFKDFTQDMDPLSRGDAVDSFTFVRRIHNSFAQDDDILQADVHLKAKAKKTERRQALAKAREAREAKKVENALATTPAKVSATPLSQDSSVNESTPTARKSTRTLRPTTRRAANNMSSDAEPDSEFISQPKPKPDPAKQPNGTRCSQRKPKPRTTKNSTAATVIDPEDEEGFHFIAYMPVQGHVWKLDGLDRFPQDMGCFSEHEGGDWMHVAQPVLTGRMAQYEASDMQFNLMAIVHDPGIGERAALLGNVKALQTIDAKLDDVYDDWRAMEGAETKKDVITGYSVELDITPADVVTAQVEASMAEEIDREDDLLKLIELRQGIVTQQAGLRVAVRDSVESANGDAEKARHRRRDCDSSAGSRPDALAEVDLPTKPLGE